MLVVSLVAISIILTLRPVAITVLVVSVVAINIILTLRPLAINALIVSRVAISIFDFNGKAEVDV